MVMNVYITLLIASYNVIYEDMSTCSVTMEQYYIKLHVKLGKSASGSMNMLKTV
jgi:hypothetical protein